MSQCQCKYIVKVKKYTYDYQERINIHYIKGSYDCIRIDLEMNEGIDKGLVYMSTDSNYKYKKMLKPEFIKDNWECFDVHCDTCESVVISKEIIKTLQKIIKYSCDHMIDVEYFLNEVAERGNK